MAQANFSQQPTKDSKVENSTDPGTSCFGAGCQEVRSRARSTLESEDRRILVEAVSPLLENQRVITRPVAIVKKLDASALSIMGERAASTPVIEGRAYSAAFLGDWLKLLNFLVDDTGRLPRDFRSGERFVRELERENIISFRDKKYDFTDKKVAQSGLILTSDNAVLREHERFHLGFFGSQEVVAKVNDWYQTRPATVKVFYAAALRMFGKKVPFYMNGSPDKSDGALYYQHLNEVAAYVMSGDERFRVSTAASTETPKTVAEFKSVLEQLLSQYPGMKVQITDDRRIAVNTPNGATINVRFPDLSRIGEIAEIDIVQRTRDVKTHQPVSVRTEKGVLLAYPLNGPNTAPLYVEIGGLRIYHPTKNNARQRWEGSAELLLGEGSKITARAMIPFSGGQAFYFRGTGNDFLYQRSIDPRTGIPRDKLLRSSEP